MQKFSDRIGITKLPETFQIDSMNDNLRNSLWNLITHLIKPNNIINNWQSFSEKLFFLFFKEKITSLPYDEYNCRNQIEYRFNNLEWYDVYNLFEIIYTIIENYSSTKKENFEKAVNNILKEELSGYSFFNGLFVPITNEVEIKSINDSIENSKIKSLDLVSEHITKSISLLSQKPKPDYHNSIKESISAVESICKILEPESSGSLKDALNKLSSQIDIHPALKDAYIKIYGYTSDEDGIRHSMTEDSSSVGLAEAKYMLVSCSAFVNYIIYKLYLQI